MYFTGKVYLLNQRLEHWVTNYVNWTPRSCVASGGVIMLTTRQLNWTKREMFRIRELAKIQWSRVESRCKSDHTARRGVITLTTRLISTRINSPQQFG